MKRRLLALSAVFLCIAFSACRKDDNSSSTHGEVNSSGDMQVPAGFDFSTSKNLQYHFSTSDLWGKEKIRVEIYDFLPSAGGHVLTSGFMDGTGKISGKVTIPANLAHVYAAVITPDGSSSMEVVQVSGGVLSHRFSEKKRGTRKSAPVSPGCNSGCDYSYNDHSGQSNISSSGVHCFMGTVGGSINVTTAGVTLRLCGTGTIGQVNLKSDTKLEIVDGADLTITNLSTSGHNSQIIVYSNATLSVGNHFGSSGSITNYGRFTAEADMVLYSGGGTFTNNGSAEIRGSFSNSNKLANNALLEISGNYELYSGSENTNTCRILIGGNFNVHDDIEVKGAYLAVSGNTDIHSGGSLNLSDRSFVQTASLTLNGQITGTGNRSLFKVAGNTATHSGSSVSGNVDLCDENGIESSQGAFAAGAVESCSLYIPVDACFPEGNGTSGLNDGDSDGVVDALDDYPQDPNVSGNVFYPSDSTYATLAFEDLWPAKGDYDFNDLVVDYRHKLVTNSSNDVVRVESEFVVKAIGGSHRKGFGFQFDVDPSAVGSVSGQLLTRGQLSFSPNGTEAGQSKATIIVFDNSSSTIINKGGTRTVNTYLEEQRKQTQKITTVVDFVAPQDIELLGDAPYNPFIYINDERGRETHLIDHLPTDLADETYLGKNDDMSDPSRGGYYKTKNNLPFALNMIGGRFDYPVEKVDIVEAYNYFDIWAQSGGTISQDWFLDFPGYRDATKVYQ